MYQRLQTLPMSRSLRDMVVAKLQSVGGDAAATTPGPAPSTAATPTVGAPRHRCTAAGASPDYAAAASSGPHLATGGVASTEPNPADAVPADPTPADPIPADPIPADPIPADPIAADPPPANPAEPNAADPIPHPADPTLKGIRLSLAAVLGSDTPREALSDAIGEAEATTPREVSAAWLAEAEVAAEVAAKEDELSFWKVRIGAEKHMTSGADAGGAAGGMREARRLARHRSQERSLGSGNGCVQSLIRIAHTAHGTHYKWHHALLPITPCCRSQEAASEASVGWLVITNDEPELGLAHKQQ